MLPPRQASVLGIIDMHVPVNPHLLLRNVRF